MYTGNPHSRRAEGITPIGLSSMSQPAAAPRPSMDTMGSWFNKPYGGGPVDSPSPFTQGFNQGWGDRTRGLNTGVQEASHLIGDQASYSPSERVYPKFIIDSLLQQGSIMPSEIRQIAPDSFQVTPRGMTSAPLRPRAYYT